MTAYYNEIDPFAAQWLRNLINAGHIAPGIVDERSIEDVYPSDLRGFTQCHFFAGIGVWSHALRASGWRDDRPVWTGSCPCQPFSAAGKGAGFDDERHLWPAFHHLIKECQPAAVLGEQVASKDSDPWIDLVHTDLEALGYAFGAIPFPASSVGAPHIRDRLYWVADASGERREWWQRPAHWRVAHGGDAGRIESHDGIARPGEAGLRLADASGQRIRAQGFGEIAATPGRVCDSDGKRQWLRVDVGAGSAAAGGLADADGWQCEQQQGDERPAGVFGKTPAAQGFVVGLGDSGSGDGARPGPTNGYWADADWLLCRDGKWRPVEPGTFPLAHGAPARVGRLRAYGNAINAKAAQAFIESVM